MKLSNRFFTFGVFILLGMLLGGYWLSFHLTTPFDLPIHPYSHTPYQYDPEMAHYLTSLAPYGGQRYEFSLHPATTLHLIGTGLFALGVPSAWWQGQSVVEFYIQNPNLMGWLLHGFLLVFNLFTATQLYRLSTPRENLLERSVSVALSLGYFGIYQMAFVGLTYWSHNLWAFPLGALIGIYSLHWVRTQGQLTRRQRWLLGIGSGAMVATVIYFAVWTVGLVMLGGLLTFVQRRKVWVAFWHAVEVGLASLLGFFIILIPAWHKLDELLGYALAIGSNAGQYGTGEQGFVTQDSFRVGLDYLLGNLQLALIVVGVAVFLSCLGMMRPQTKQPSKWALLVLQFTLLAQFILLSILLIKQPSITYFSAPNTLAILMLATSYHTLPQSLGLRRTVGVLFIGAVLVLIPLNLHSTLSVQTHEQQDALHQQELIQSTRAEFAERVQQSPDNVRVLYAFDTPSPCYALWFGDGFANRVASHAIQARCPNDLYYDSNSGSVWNGQIKSIYDADFCWDLIFLPTETLRQNTQDFPHTEALGAGLSVVYNEARYAPVSQVLVEFDREMCGEGWHHAEQVEQTSYRWMSHPTSTIDMHLMPNSDYRITVQIFSAISDEVMSTLRLKVNGETLPLIGTDAPARYQATLPAEVVNRYEHATQFTFTVERTATPNEGDTRQLGVAFDWVEITSLGGGTSVE